MLTFLAVIDNAGSGIRGDDKAICAKNRTDTRSGLGEDIGNDRSAVLDTVNKTNAGLSLRGDVKDTRLAIVNDKLVVGDDKLAVGDDELAVNNNESTARISKKTDVDDGLNAQTGN